MSQVFKLHQRLISQGKTVALAESCSGGHLAARFTALPGASSYFLGSVVSYAEEWKETILHVSKKTLQVEGAISEETVKEMLRGIYALSRADYTVAVTGIAGPSGGSSTNPVGTVWIAYGIKEKLHNVVQHRFKGERLEVISALCDEVIETLVSLVQ